MKIEVYSKSKGDIIYKNVTHISTSVRNYLLEGENVQLPIYELSILQQNHHESINLDDVTGFTIYDSPATWIDDATDIVCPHCGQNYDFDIMNMAHGERIMQFCPKCGNKVDVDSYFNDTIKE